MPCNTPEHQPTKRGSKERLIAVALAKDKRATTYESAQPCPRGHAGARWIKGGTCVECGAEKYEAKMALAATKTYEPRLSKKASSQCRA